MVEEETVLMRTQREPCFLSYSNPNKNDSVFAVLFPRSDEAASDMLIPDC